MSYNLGAWEVTPCLLRHTPGIHVRVGMVTSLNGYITNEDGTSRGIGGAADRAALLTLRHHADAVISTAATVVAEGLRPASTRLYVVLTATNKLSTSLPLFQEGVERVLILAGNQVSSESIASWREAGAKVHQVEDELVDVRWLIEWLRDEHQVERVVCEGGPMLNAQMSDAGLVDEWCITISTKLLAHPGREHRDCHSITGPINTPKTLNLRHILATSTDIVGIFSTHDISDKTPQVSAA